LDKFLLIEIVEVDWILSGRSKGNQASTKWAINQLLQKYWGIENELDCRRDVILGEDASYTAGGTTGHSLAIINNFVISLSL